MKELISIIIPVYNVEKYIERCVNSVINQSYTNLEILLINDGSTDNSTNICRDLANRDCRIVYIEKENEGLGPTRNLGIKKSTAEYIMFIDSDDWWEHDTVEKMYNAAKKNNADMVYMNFFYSVLQEDGTYKEREFVQYCLFDGIADAKQKNELVFSMDARIWSKMYRKVLFTENELYMPAHPFEDFPVMPILVLHAKTICQVHEPLYHYFQNRQNNLSGNIDNYRYIPIGINELYVSLKKYGYFEKYQANFKEYAFLLCRDALNKRIFSNTEEKFGQDIEKQFWNVLNKYCKDKLRFAHNKVYIWGSYSNFVISMRILFNNQISGVSVFDSPRYIEGNNINPCTEDFSNADYYFVDLLDETTKFLNENYSEKEITCAIVGRMNQIIEKFNMASKHSKVKLVILCLYLSEKLGVDKEHTKLFEQLNKIRQLNLILEKCYKKLERQMEKVVSISFEEFDNYTYINTPEGCLPCFYNGKFHTNASRKIERILTESEQSV